MKVPEPVHELWEKRKAAVFSTGSALDAAPGSDDEKKHMQSAARDMMASRDFEMMVIHMLNVAAVRGEAAIPKARQ